MPSENLSFLSPPARDTVQQLRAAEIVIGMPTYNHAGTIVQVIETVNSALRDHYREAQCLLVLSDAHSNDGTPALVQQCRQKPLATVLFQHPVYPVHKMSIPYHGIPAKNTALQMIFRIARALQARACCILDTSSNSLTSQWLLRLLKPILEEGYDFVAPIYVRHRFDGMLTRLIVYPTVRALFGRPLRQPLAGEFCLSGSLVSHCLAKNIWESDVARYGIDLWISTTALCDGFKVAQTCLGPRLQDTRSPVVDLTSIYTQVVGALLTVLEASAMAWQKTLPSQAVPTFGEASGVLRTPVNVNVEKMLNTFRLGMEALVPFLEMILSGPDLQRLQEIAGLSGRKFCFPNELWVRVVYDFAAAFHHRVWPTDQLMKAMLPLYLGRTAAFVIRHRESAANAIEDDLEGLCQEFERNRAYLQEKWQRL